MGEHGKRAAPKAAATTGAAAEVSTSHGRNRATRVEKDRSRRWGPLTAETAIVLGVAAAIIAGAFVVEAVQPATERTNTISGEDTVEVHQVGKGGIKPGAVQPRTIIPRPVATTAPTALPTKTPKPGKTPKPVVTAAPTDEPGGGVDPDPGTGGGTCTPIPLIRTCPDPEPEPEPTQEPEPTAEPEPTTAPTTKAGTQGAASASQTAKKKKPTPSPGPASPR